MLLIKYWDISLTGISVELNYLQACQCMEKKNYDMVKFDCKKLKISAPSKRNTNDQLKQSKFSGKLFLTVSYVMKFISSSTNAVS